LPFDYAQGDKLFDYAQGDKPFDYAQGGWIVMLSGVEA
jgi:hypothetical protein